MTEINLLTYILLTHKIDNFYLINLFLLYIALHYNAYS